MDQCKGFEDDAKKFVLLVQDHTEMQVDYDMLRPLFLRTMKHKKGADVLKAFEQFRKTLKINKHNFEFKNATPEEKTAMSRQLKLEFYDGLINDLEANNGTVIANVIIGEKIKDGFEHIVEEEEEEV